MYYQKLLDREKDSPSLVKIYWYVLIDNLGMAYGISKKLDAAENIFRYGVSKDPTYPLFYYNLACTYAEREDMDRAIEYLRTAYKFKNNMITGETIPDPMSDDSFQRFVGNKLFVDAVKEMQQK
jgi:tetratricopeptide (TPR) repeat protein